MRRIKFRREARQEFDEAAHWYWEQDPGLRIAFVAEMRATFQRIRTMPEAFPIVHVDLRRAIAHRFPYAVELPRRSADPSVAPPGKVGLYEHRGPAHDFHRGLRGEIAQCGRGLGL